MGWKWRRGETCQNFIFSFTLLDRRLSSLGDALRDSNLLNPLNPSLYLAQPIDAGADFKPTVNSKPNLNCIYIDEDARFDDERENDLVLKVLQILVKTFSNCWPIYFMIWIAREQIVTRDKILPSCCASSRMKSDNTPECLVPVWSAVLNLRTIQL